jgi:gliding motility-associated lipoprotein GldH
MRFRLLFLSIVAFAIISCDDSRVYDEYQSLGSAWHKDSIVKFDLPKMEETKPFNLFLTVRTNNDYPFNNLYLLVSMEQPDGLTKVDTLEYAMANPDGSLMGNGFSDTKESKLFYKENFKFDKKGVYKISIQQAVRQMGKVAGIKELNGLTDVGFRVEK